ncbi:MAG: hypothetical protein O2780_19735 [Proteobacteria bacterium]|jgi:hypothetical protein|nr:hypothetical protein [Pseudomonadota bacterium]MDA1298888.1 hypothetical protein [Pseudomonadota bacterium]
MSIMNYYASVGDRPCLVNRTADFWLLGGASIFFWGICHGLEVISPHYDTVDIYRLAVPAMFSFFALMVNMPHFMASYHLAYTRGRPFIREYWFQLILVPLLLVSVLIVGDMLFFAPTDGWRAFGEGLNLLLQPLGIFIVVGAFDSLGAELLHHLLTLMYLTVGWHYAKQTFGCFVVYSKYDGYSLTAQERNLIKASVFCVWAFIFFSSNTQIQSYEFLTATYLSHLFPDELRVLFQWLTPGLYLYIAWFVFVRRWKENAELPPAPAIAAWLAMFVWWMPFGTSLTFLLTVPFFHALQYLPFYKKIIDMQHDDPERGTRSFNFYFVLLMLAGFLAFNVMPESMDLVRDSVHRTSMTYWIVGIYIVINVHHYFIDNAIWRMKDDSVRKWLIG